MAERDLLFHDTVAPQLAAYAPSHPIRNRLLRLLRLPSDSPDLLAIIKQEGKV